MALRAYPLNDTDYTAEDAQLYTATRTSGVYADNHFNISVTGADNNVTIKPGMGWMKLAMFQGIAVANDEDFTINAGVPDSTLPRIDAVVYAYDENANKPEIIIKQGEKGANPTPPAVVRSGFRHELHLYHIRRRPGATAITPGDITDLRMDVNYCGLMADSVTQVDMTAINAQVREFISDWENQIANVTDGKMIESPEYPGCYYRMNRGVKEWLNPPMMEDVEYPTTKRQDGKRVYTKLLKARSQAGSVFLPDIERIVSVFAVAERDWNGEKLMFQLPVDFLPEDTPAVQKMQIYYQGNTINFQSVVAKGLYNLYITVEYTKPGDEVAYTNVTADGDTVNVETNGDVSSQGDNLNVEMYTTVSADGGAYIRRLTINGVAYDLAVGQAGSGVPGAKYPGIPGMFYTNIDSGAVYVCLKANPALGIYVWSDIIPENLYVKNIKFRHDIGIGYAEITADKQVVNIQNGGADAVIRGVADPVAPTDAVNKQYLEQHIGEHVEFAESVEWLDANGDTAKKYVLPDGYIYAWMNKTVEVEFNANDGTGAINKYCAGARGDTLSDKPGNWVTPYIAIDPTEMAPVGAAADTVVTISGLDKIVPVYNGSAIWVYYYRQDGSQIGAYKGSQLAGLYSDAEVTLPLSLYLKNTAIFADSNWATVRGVRISLGISASGSITEDDIKNLKVSIPFFNYTKTDYGWYSTGQQHSNDKDIQQNSADIAALKENVAALQEAVKTSPSASGAKWFAIGDSITYGLYSTSPTAYHQPIVGQRWVDYVAKYNGYELTNLGKSNAGFLTSPTFRSMVDGADFANADLVTIMLGINDWKYEDAVDKVGTMDDDISTGGTIVSELRYGLEKIIADNPYCKIILITPINAKIGSRGTEATNWAYGFDGTITPCGSLKNFGDKLKEVCEYYGIQVIDMTNSSVVNRKSITTILPDGIHPNLECYKALGLELARRITFA